uniref:Uncharacterized protein n=1 Tax=Knipowitschia caucasica TaxID=637954 RepID=A0AAV2JLK4_KNICA
MDEYYEPFLTLCPVPAVFSMEPCVELRESDIRFRKGCTVRASTLPKDKQSPSLRPRPPCFTLGLTQHPPPRVEEIQPLI